VIDDKSGTKDNIMIRCIALVALLVLPALGWADRLPPNYPEEVMYEGSIDGVDFSARTVVIGDVVFYISPTTRVMIPSGRQGSRAELQLGTSAGCNYQIDPDRRYILTDVWILPPGAAFGD
jgi:hypothetical protein